MANKITPEMLEGAAKLAEKLDPRAAEQMRDTAAARRSK